MSKELLVIDTGFQARNSDLQARKTNWTSLFRIVPASDAVFAMVTDAYLDHKSHSSQEEKIRAV
jgi:hypothetical protein